MNQQTISMDDRRKQLLQFIYEYCLLEQHECNPKIILNRDDVFFGKAILFSRRDAVDSILRCENFLGVPEGVLRKKFPLQTYFGSGSSTTFLSSPSPFM